ncbi:hypothetical protein [Halorhabdus salina]|uniref:hypothetical protein n=1 Tax=Halorhabdus salina TaxID=2750670 RepID=UPI0015EF0B77|nr:hypothetical protein [Halorhabdus salina]
MSLAEFGVDPDEPEIEETRYEFETQAGPWTLVDSDLDESVTPAQPRCPDCGDSITGEPVLLHYGREDGLLLACRLCEDCHNIFPMHTASNPDVLERSGLSHPHWCLRLYGILRATDDQYPNFDIQQLDLDGEIPLGGDER